MGGSNTGTIFTRDTMKDQIDAKQHKNKGSFKIEWDLRRKNVPTTASNVIRNNPILGIVHEMENQSNDDDIITGKTPGDRGRYEAMYSLLLI